jgi:hypothetical protein
MIKEKFLIFKNRVSEAFPACLLTMVQGNVLALSLPHWIKALQVGALTGVLAVIVSLVRKDLQDNKFVIAGLTGFLTAVSDFLLHPSHFGGQSSEAVVTGVGAGLLCLALSGVRK